MKIDLPMAQEAVRLGTKIALIATLETTLGPSQRLIEKVGAEQGKKMECTQYLQNPAWDALQAGHPEEHNRILMESIRELDKMGYDAIVMAQVSMRALLPDLKDVKTPLLCSFFSGYGPSPTSSTRSRQKRTSKFLPIQPPGGKRVSPPGNRRSCSARRDPKWRRERRPGGERANQFWMETRAVSTSQLYQGGDLHEQETGI